MNWKKETYLILCSDGNDRYRQYVNGIVTTIDGLKVGIHKADSNAWIITDMSTGCALHITNTQREAKQWLDKYSDVVKDILTSAKHKQYEREFERWSIR